MNLIDDSKNKININDKEAFYNDQKNYSDDIVLDNSLNKLVMKDINYPTKEEFEEHKRKIQQNELNSERFKKAKKFLMDYNKRENKELEKKLFKIIGTYGLEDNLINKSFDEKIINKIKRYNKLKKFMNSLTESQINSNLYLKAVSIFMETSIEDCEFIIRRFKEKVEDLELSDKNQRLELNTNIPKKRLKFFPSLICEQVGILYYKPQDYKIAYINVLDTKNSNVYVEYNNYVRNILKLATDIYHLQMTNLLSMYPEQIYNYYFSINNNDSKHEFVTAYFVKKCREKNGVKKENKSSKLCKKTKENISKAIGLPFDEIANMELEDLEKYLNQRVDRKNVYNLRLIIDEILIEEDISLSQTDKELDKNISGFKMVLKRKNNNK